MAGFTSFPRVTSSSASNLLCLGLGTTGTTTPLDLVRLVGAPLALVRLVGFFMARFRVLWRVFGMAYHPREQICPKCDGKNFNKNGICMHCGHNYIDNFVTKFLEPIGWLIDNHPIVFWSLIIGAAAAIIYSASTGQIE